MSDAKKAYEFEGGYPTPETVQQAYDDIDLNRAIQAYRFFYPTVSVAAIYKGNLKAGVIPNKAFIIMYGNPNQIVLTPNSDTPYAGGAIDLTEGPIIVVTGSNLLSMLSEYAGIEAKIEFPDDWQDTDNIAEPIRPITTA